MQVSGLLQTTTESRQLVRNIIISEHDRQCKNLFLLSFVHPVLTYVEETFPVLIEGSPFREPDLVLAIIVPGVGLISQSPKPFSK